MGSRTSAPIPPDKSARARILADSLIASILPISWDSSHFVRSEIRTYPSFRTEEYENARQGTYIGDVESTVHRFGRLAQAIGTAWTTPLFPVWTDSEGRLVPVDLTDLFLEGVSIGAGIKYPITEYVMQETFRRRFSEPLEPRPNEYSLRLVPIQVALEALQLGLLEFLGIRLEPDFEDTPRVARSLGAAARKPSSNPYLPFSVHTSSRGIDVEQAPAYFLSWTFFGGPTTPADGWILPGLYRFRGRDRNGNYRNDPTTFMVPPLGSANTIL